MPTIEKQTSNQVKTLTFVVAAVVAAMVGWSMVRPVNIRSKAELDKVAAKLNQSVPMPLDRDTELTNATAEEGVLIYNYRLLNFAAADVPPDVLTQRVKPLATNHACATPDTRKALLDPGVTLRYRYYDKEKVYVGEFDVDSADCR